MFVVIYIGPRRKESIGHSFHTFMFHVFHQSWLKMSSALSYNSVCNYSTVQCGSESVLKPYSTDSFSFHFLLVFWIVLSESQLSHYSSCPPTRASRQAITDNRFRIVLYCTGSVECLAIYSLHEQGRRDSDMRSCFFYCI